MSIYKKNKNTSLVNVTYNLRTLLFNVFILAVSKFIMYQNRLTVLCE